MPKPRKPVINPTNRKQFRKASASAVSDLAYSRLKRYAAVNRWLPNSNRYRKNTIQRLLSDLGATPATLDAEDLANYVVSSAPTHTIDGWSFLGRAIGAAIQGDPASCIHLAYYAELRAAMALLAAEGIGVFANQHFVVTKVKQASQITCGSGTHKVVWPFLDCWARTRRSMDLLDGIIRPEGINMTQWLQSAGFGSSSHRIARIWFGRWGLDLKRLDEDHESRNHASYRPSEFTSVNPVSATAIFDFLRELWRLFEPAGPNSFPFLDLELLRVALEREFENLKDRPARGDKDYATAVDLALSAGAFDEGKTNLLRSFLLRETQTQTSSVIDAALRDDDRESSDFHLQVLSRAALLLRFATGASRNLLISGDITAARLGFWLNRYGPAHSLWDSRTPPENVSELWSDIAESLTDFSAYRTTAKPEDLSLYYWHRTRPADITTFSATELIGIWGLAA